jgi:hypothetical protein
MKSTWRFILGASTLAAAAAFAAIPAQAGSGPGRSILVRTSATAPGSVTPVRPGAAVALRKAGPGWDRTRWGHGRQAWRHDHGRPGRRDRAWGLYDAAGYGYGYGYGPAAPAYGAGLLDGRLLGATPELQLPTKFDLPRVAGYHGAEAAAPVFYTFDDGFGGAPPRSAARAGVAPSARIVTVGVDQGFASGRAGPRIIAVPAR